jgi:hypothetical protein
MQRAVIMGIVVVTASVGSAGCGSDEIPQTLRGSYKVPRFILGNQTVVVEGKQFRSPDCKVNCGVPALALTSIKCEPLVNPTKCTYKSEHCTGSIELDSDGKSVSIVANVVPGATGDALGTRNMTCAGISGNRLERL